MAAGKVNLEQTPRPRATIGQICSRECNESLATCRAAHDDRHTAWFRARTWQRGIRIGRQPEVHHAPQLGTQRPVHAVAFESLEMFALAVTLAQQLDCSLERRVDPEVQLAGDVLELTATALWSAKRLAIEHPSANGRVPERAAARASANASRQ